MKTAPGIPNKMVVNCPSCYKTHEIDQGSIQWECEACKIKIAKSLPAVVLYDIIVKKLFMEVRND
jgi:ribosomal protein L37AE/L43A